MHPTPKLKMIDSGQAVAFFCPGCKDTHEVRVGGGDHAWSWNNDLVLPTFFPSIKVTSGHYIKGRAGVECWCTYDANRPQKSGFTCYRCHSYVRDGKIRFLADSTHALAGQTVEIPAWEDVQHGRVPQTKS